MHIYLQRERERKRKKKKIRIRKKCMCAVLYKLKFFLISFKIHMILKPN